MDNPFFFLLLGLLVAWVGSYFYSFQHNRRKLRLLASWLKEALGLLGTRTTSRWRGADRLDVAIEEGRGNIREAALVVATQSRQLFRAMVSLVRGGRDSLTILVALRKETVPGREFEIFEAKGPAPRHIDLTLGTVSAWQIEDYSRNPAYRIAFRTPAAHDNASQVLALLLDDGFNVRRLSVRPTAPHLMLVLNMVSSPKVEAASLMRLVKTLSDEVAQPFKQATPSKPAAERTPKARRSNPALLYPKEGGSSTPGSSTNGYHSSNGHSPSKN